MRFDERFLEEIKARLRPSDVIGRTVRLRRQGREYVGLSPFSKEKSPSFFVNDDKGFFHDFSSGKHGDIIGFLQETERLSFREAVEKLAAEAGVPLPAPDPRAAEADRRRLGLGEWMEEAAKWFEAQLRRPPGEAARQYLDRRGLPEAERARFRIGFAPASRTGLKDHLIAKGAQPRDLVEAGLLIAPEDNGAPYDRFRDRIIFPIEDARGRLVSFGGRAMDPEAKAKYLNGPETSLFHKGSTLYGLPEARKLLHLGGEGASLVIVEGYMDAIACQRAGIAAAAPLGTALTEEQMELVWRLHPEPTLAMDADAAGLRAAARVMDRALPLLKPGRSFRFALISGGKDPDDVLREHGAAALKAQLGETKPFVQALFERERDLETLDTPERRAGLKVRLRKLAATIADPDLSQSYRQDLLSRFEGLWRLEMPAYTASDAGRALRGRRGERFKERPQGATNEGKAAARQLANALRPLAAAVAKALLDDPDRMEEQIETLEVQGFGDTDLSEIAREIIRARIQAVALDSKALERHLAAQGYDQLLKEISKAAAKSGAPFLDPGMPLEEARTQWSLALEVLTRMAALERAVVAAKADLASDFDMPAFMQLKSERDALRREIKTGSVWDEPSASLTTH
ncbi:MAG: DNA primase [Caulobacteraceae bacterium]